MPEQHKEECPHVGLVDSKDAGCTCRERLDTGHLDAALERVDIYSLPDSIIDYEVICNCGWQTTTDVDLLALVRLVAEHSQQTCTVGKR